jgi:hypothetical protein
MNELENLGDMATDYPTNDEPLWTDKDLERFLKVHEGWARKDRLKASPTFQPVTIGRLQRYVPSVVRQKLAGSNAA